MDMNFGIAAIILACGVAVGFLIRPRHYGVTQEMKQREKLRKALDK